MASSRGVGPDADAQQLRLGLDDLIDAFGHLALPPRAGDQIVPAVVALGAAADVGEASWTSAQSGDKVRAGDEKAIRQLVATFESGWNTNDMKAIGSIFRDDAEFINLVGMHWRGRDAIVKAHVAYHAIMFKD
jgi:hypothetical protein